MYPDKFCNVTNGIAHRRWLCYSNPALARLLDESIGIGAAKELRMEHFGHDVVNTELCNTGSQRIGKLTGQIGLTDYSEMFSLSVYAYYISH